MAGAKTRRETAVCACVYVHFEGLDSCESVAGLRRDRPRYREATR